MEERFSSLVSRLELAVISTNGRPAPEARPAQPDEQEQQRAMSGADVGLVELQRMLMALQHMEQKEQQIRCD